MKIEKETQRYGRNKATTINLSYIDSEEYRNKFDNISNNKILNRKVYQLAKRMLKHRSGTLFEDMYWLDITSARIIASETSQHMERRIKYSKKTQKVIKKNTDILAIHSHPSSMPPSISDFNSAFKNNYRICLVCCHDGKLYMYRSYKHVIEFFYKNTIAKYKRRGYSEFDAQLKTLDDFQKNGYILFKEVVA